MIQQFRQIWHDERGESACHGDSADPEYGCRSAGKVARWSLMRAAEILRQNGRGSLRIAAQGDSGITPHERSLAIVHQSLASGDRESARRHGEWLVHPRALDAFLRALDPVASGPARLALRA